MENNLENAVKYLDDKYGYTRERSEENDKWINEMLAYASACSAPSSIGEEMKLTVSDEEIYKACPNFDIITKGDFDAIATTMMEEAFISGAKWAISRLSERKIVLPSDEDFKSVRQYQDSQLERHGWNSCIYELKRLNGIN